jgi:dihydroneopterin aldolase
LPVRGSGHIAFARAFAVSQRRAGPHPRAFVQTGAIRVRGMRFWGKHGVTAVERRAEQPIDVDVSLRLGLATAARSDALRDTVDYEQIVQTCQRIVTRQSFVLLEALAHAIVEALWERHEPFAVRVLVRKPRRLEGATPEVHISRRRRLP